MTPGSPADSNLPTIIGRYQLLKRVGAGGMGTVYKARHLDLGREVALKILPRDLADKQEMLERFHQEAKNAAKLRHEHIVTLYEFGEDNGIHYLAMEFVEGKNLHEYIDHKVRLEPEEARKLMIQAARALLLAHREGIVHRDIKPSNFLLTQKEGKLFVKLTDFGLARSIDDSDFKVTRSGTTVGTVDYISPEQARNSRAADIRSDIYSLGCTFYHMLAGRVPFPGGDMAERLLKHVEATPPDVRTFSSAVPPGMVVVLSRMLAKRPEDRYQTPKDLLRELEHLPSGPILSPRELLEALALDAGAKPRNSQRTGSDKIEAVPSDSARLLGQTLLPGEIPKLRYRHLKMQDKKPRSRADGGRGSSALLSIQGWKAWTAIAGGTTVVIAVTIAVALGLRLEPPDERESTARTDAPAPPVKEESYVRNLEKSTEINPGERPFNSLESSRKGEPDQPNIAGLNPGSGRHITRPRSFSPPVYQPPPDQVALLQKQFQMAPNMPPEVRTGQPSSSRGPPAPGTNPASKSAGSEPQPPATKTAPRPAATVLIVSRFPFGSDGKHFDSLKAACAAAVAEQDTIIEIHDNGPIFEGPVAVAGRNLTLRAGKGFRPLIVWDIQAAASARSPQFFSMARGSLAMENLDIGLKVADLSQDERTSLFRIEGGDLSAENCTFSVAGRHRAGTSVIRIDPSRGEVGPCKCRLVNCLVRGADVMALDARAAGAEVTLDRCLLICTGRPVVEVVGKAGATPTIVRAVHSTLVAGQALLRVRPASAADKNPAVHWLLWDSLLGHCGYEDGALLDLQDGTGTSGMQWRAINCLYSGWGTLLKRETGSLQQHQLEVWRKLWNSDEGDKVALETWPAVVPPDPSETPAAAFRVVGTHAGFSDSIGASTLGCDVSLLPPARDNWLSITYERVAPAVADLPAVDQAPAIPDLGDGRYHGEQLDLTGLNLGDYLRDMQQRKKFGPRVVLRLRGKGEVRTGPIHVKGAGLVLFFEPPEENQDRLVLVPKSAADREALIEVEDGSCEILGGKIRFPNTRNIPVPQYLVKVQGGHLYVVGCHLEGPTGQVPNSYRGLVLFLGSGETTADQAHECALTDSILLSGSGCVHAVGAGLRLRVQNCALVAGSEAFHLEPALGAATRLNAQCLLERNTVTARRTIFRLGDAVQLPGAIDPLVIQAKANVFVDLFAGPERHSGLLAIEGDALAHGLMLWQGDGNVYDKQFQYYAAARDQAPPSVPQPHLRWTRLWGTACDRRCLFVDPLPRALDLNNLQLDQLILPETFRSKIRGPLPGADLEQLGIVKKSKKK